MKKAENFLQKWRLKIVFSVCSVATDYSSHKSNYIFYPGLL